ncbi:hypothetical protein Tco_0025691 [Tanacetum coccineum]
MFSLMKAEEGVRLRSAAGSRFFLVTRSQLSTLLVLLRSRVSHNFAFFSKSKVDGDVGSYGMAPIVVTGPPERVKTLPTSILFVFSPDDKKVLVSKISETIAESEEYGWGSVSGVPSLSLHGKLSTKDETPEPDLSFDIPFSLDSWKEAQWRQHMEQMSSIKEQAILRNRSIPNPRARKKPMASDGSWEEDTVKENVVIRDDHPDQPVVINGKWSIECKRGVLGKVLVPGCRGQRCANQAKGLHLASSCGLFEPQQSLCKGYHVPKVEEKLGSLVGHQYKCFLRLPNEASRVQMSENDEGTRQAKLTEKHLKEVKRILCYLWGTINMGLWYTKDFGFELTGFSDADYAGCKDTFKSTSDGAHFFGKKLLTDYGCHFNKIPIYWDSKSAIAISCTPVQQSRTKHIVVCYHFIKEHVEKGTIELYFVKTDYQLADLFTKALTVDQFNYLGGRLGMRSLSP